MRVRHFAAAALVAALGVVAVGAGGASGGATANTLTVWLMVDAQSGWSDVVASANQQFKAQNPGWDVDVQYQTWGTYRSKLDAALAGGGVPDVVEVGNTQTTPYMAAGAFQDLSSVNFPNESTWLSGLEKAGRYGGKTYGVPYYAGSRVITYRTDLFRQVNAKIPTSLGEFEAVARKLGARNKAKTFSPVYIAGTDWYFAMSFVYDYGGTIAVTNKGKWIGTLDRPKAVAGLTAYKRFFDAASRASKTTDEVRPNPYDVYAQGNAAAMPGPAWFSCCVGDFKNRTAQFVMPSRTKGQPMPGFLGGSVLAAPVGGNRAMAAAWISAFTDNASMTALRAKGNIPNTTSLLGTSVNERAAQRSWFVPTAKHWASVESGNMLRTMLSRILTGKMSVKDAAEVASDNITFTLNQK
ncbi:MAG TPA: extracellular solute-binding protein [Gaiellaceae bacterium]|jgi:N,N'-diacetylchitobiose transport system substrate-binding protein|nr:extracellular solute-binding protein [Gaiellaceae bacterium]